MILYIYRSRRLALSPLLRCKRSLRISFIYGSRVCRSRLYV